MAEPENLTHEMLRRLQGKLDDIQSEMRLRFTGVETGISRIEQHLSAFFMPSIRRAQRRSRIYPAGWNGSSGGWS